MHAPYKEYDRLLHLGVKNLFFFFLNFLPRQSYNKKLICHSMCYLLSIKLICKEPILHLDQLLQEMHFSWHKNLLLVASDVHVYLYSFSFVNE